MAMPDHDRRELTPSTGAGMAQTITRVKGALRMVLSRPTWIAQGISAISSLLLVVIYTRKLSAESFAVYAVVMATYAFAMALVGTTINTRIIESGSAREDPRVRLAAASDFPAMGLCLLSAAGAVLLTKSDPLLVVTAMVGMAGTLVAQLAGAHLLGARRFWGYAGLILLQMVIWDAASLVGIFAIAPAHRLAAVFVAVGLGGIPGLVYLLRGRRISVSWRHPDRNHSAISSVGVASLALWILASGDRLILARYSLTSLATYVATYGLLDRIFRTLAAAETQQRLPLAYAATSAGKDVRSAPSRLAIGLMLGLGVALSACCPTAVSIISGGNYQPPFLMAVTLSFAMVAMLGAVPFFVTLIVTGRGRTAAAIAIFAASVNILGNFLLASRYGTSSAAVLTLVGYAIWLIGSFAAARQRSSKIDLTQGGREEADLFAAAEQVGGT
jgi:O-antigen/teichoic acid export membrane protein